ARATPATEISSARGVMPFNMPADIKRGLRQCNPWHTAVPMSSPRLPAGALLVEPRILRRVIRRHRRLSGLGVAVFHGHGPPLPRAEPLERAEPTELGVDELADQPILLPSDTPPERIWPRIFHALVHQALAARRLTPAMLRERIHRIGQIEFDEIRFILRQDDLLLPPRDDATTYEELAAHWLQLRRLPPRPPDPT